MVARNNNPLYNYFSTFFFRIKLVTRSDNYVSFEQTVTEHEERGTCMCVVSQLKVKIFTGNILKEQFPGTFERCFY
jgi:hypothetical protein